MGNMSLFDDSPERDYTPAPYTSQRPGDRPGSRNDIHRPSAIDPADYDFVAHECVKVYPGDFGACEFQRREREAIQAHMARTGGNYSSHQHGGNCMVCGSVNAIYTLLFYHAKSNVYVRLGADCAQKMFNGNDFGASAFRRKYDDVREALAGKRKAAALLADSGLSLAWDLFTTEYDDTTRETLSRYEERTIRDIVGKLVQYGSISDNTWAFLGKLVRQLADRPARDAAREAYKAAAADCPTGRMVIEGKVLTIRVDDTPYGSVTKMLVAHASGFKVWGTRPSGLNCDRGDVVRFTATIQPSDKDPKFGFAGRPTKAEIITSASTQEPAQ